MFLKNYGMSLFGARGVNGKKHGMGVKNVLFIGDVLNGCSCSWSREQVQLLRETIPSPRAEWWQPYTLKLLTGLVHHWYLICFDFVVLSQIFLLPHFKHKFKKLWSSGGPIEICRWATCGLRVGQHCLRTPPVHHRQCTVLNSRCMGKWDHQSPLVSRAKGLATPAKRDQLGRLVQDHWPSWHCQTRKTTL